jgi:hypothetical protein
MAIAPALRSIAKAILPRKTVEYLKRRLPSVEIWPPVPFDNMYPWLNYTFSELVKNERCAQRPQYAWGGHAGCSACEGARTTESLRH